MNRSKFVQYVALFRHRGMVFLGFLVLAGPIILLKLDERLAALAGFLVFGLHGLGGIFDARLHPERTYPTFQKVVGFIFIFVGIAGIIWVISLFIAGKPIR